MPDFAWRGELGSRRDLRPPRCRSRKIRHSWFLREPERGFPGRWIHQTKLRQAERGHGNMGKWAVWIERVRYRPITDPVSSDTYSGTEVPKWNHETELSSGFWRVRGGHRHSELLDKKSGFWCSKRQAPHVLGLTGRPRCIPGAKRTISSLGRDPYRKPRVWRDIQVDTCPKASLGHETLGCRWQRRGRHP